jgi:CRISPR-associated protein Csc3
LRELRIDHTLIYHRFRNCTGLLTNSIHNALLHLTEKLDWQAILFFAEGVVYLAPLDSELPDRAELQATVWEEVSSGLAAKMLTGEIGFKRDGKGLKVAPQTLEFLSPAQLIRSLPSIVSVTIRNETAPATPKRLARLDISPAEMEFLLSGADLRTDRIAEFIVLLQKEFFGTNPEFIACVLDQLELRAAITPEQTQVHTGGCYWGWYHVAAYYVASNTSLNLEDTTAKLQELANRLVAWAEAKHLLPVQSNSTREVFGRLFRPILGDTRVEQPKTILSA